MTASAADSITFTSYADDSRGGDTNADGEASLPIPGSWGGVSVHGSGSVFNGCEFLYAGRRAAIDMGALEVMDGAAVSITNSVFAHTRPADPSMNAVAALELGDASVEGVVLGGNRFFDNTVPLRIAASHSIDDSNVFDSGEGRDPRHNRYQGVQVTGGWIENPVLWTIQAVPLVYGGRDDLNIDPAGTLSIGPRVVVKFQPSGRVMVAEGARLQIDPTARMTSVVDDYLADSNGDGAMTSPSGVEWRGILRFRDGNSTLECDHDGYMHYETPGCAL